jgi:hypothetical protein
MISGKFSPYVLMCAVVVSSAAGLNAQAKRAASDDADQKELYNYVLTLDKIQRFAGVQKDLEALEKSNPQLAKTMDSDDSNGKNISQLAQNMEKYPPVIAVLRKNGLTTREYAVGILTLMQAGMAVGFKKAGTYKEYPPEMLKLVSPANLAFVEQHYADITKAMPTSDKEKEDDAK